ncbi:DUF2789 family protein [Pseudomonas tolaasii]|uniref:DUF2789 family protein n=1 Tax=Pseudomonas tolaasii TaxID=29442 RepID=UPI0002EFFB7E
MESPVHSLPSLFKQLGLRDDPVSIEKFVAVHSPLKPELKLADAFFWTPSQKAFCAMAFGKMRTGLKSLMS